MRKKEVDPIPEKFESYKAAAEFWDTHDLSDYWDQTTPVEFEVDIQSEAVYYAIEPKLSAKISRIAKKRGVPAETLLNLWLKEKLSEERASK